MVILGGIMLGKITNPNPTKETVKRENVQINGVFSSRRLRLLINKPLKSSPNRGMSAKI
jgi:hypothetical protein